MKEARVVVRNFMLPGRTNTGAGGGAAAAGGAAGGGGGGAAAAAAHERFVFRLTNFACSTCGRIFKRASRTTPYCVAVGVARCLFVTW